MWAESGHAPRAVAAPVSVLGAVIATLGTVGGDIKLALFLFINESALRDSEFTKPIYTKLGTEISHFLLRF